MHQIQREEQTQRREDNAAKDKGNVEDATATHTHSINVEQLKQRAINVNGRDTVAKSVETRQKIRFRM